MKTWEIYKRINENPKEMVEKKFRLVKGVLFGGDENIVIGDVAQVARFGTGFFGLSDKDGCRIRDLTGFEEWEEIKEPVSFMEVVKSEKYFTVTHELIQHKHDFENMDLHDFATELTNAFHSYQIKKILLEGKFYIED